MMWSRLRRLALLDIDGTLLWADGWGRASIEATLMRVYGTAGSIASYYLPGRTDKEIVYDVLKAHGLGVEQIETHFDRIGEVMVEEMRTRRAEHTVRPCPGGHALVTALAARDDVLLGLLTGNSEQTAILKLQAAGYDPGIFRIGAFGEESVRRADLPPLAVQRAYALTGHRFEGNSVVIIGDAPADITCGRGIGARSIVVLTGQIPCETLAAENPDYIFEDLTDLDAVLAAILD
jgi:phosphoglycolate phosphatase